LGLVLLTAIEATVKYITASYWCAKFGGRNANGVNGLGRDVEVRFVVIVSRRRSTSMNQGGWRRTHGRLVIFKPKPAMTATGISYYPTISIASYLGENRPWVYSAASNEGLMINVLIL